jgi:hypothetical protein
MGPESFGFTSSTGNLVRVSTPAQALTSSPSNQDICDVLANGREHFVLLYDTKNEIGWYLPQASVVLNMAHAKIANRKYQLYDDDRMIWDDDTTAFARLGSDGWAKASDAIKMSLRLKVRKYYCSKTGPIEEDFGNIIRKTWHSLDNVEAYLASKEPQFQNHAPHCIHGVEYVHVMNEEGSTRMHIKEAIVNQAWAHLTYLEPIVIFTKDLSPPIAPDTSSLCRSWMKVPSGRKYLVIMGTAARSFLDRQDAGIAESVSWEFGQELIQSHEPGSITPIFHVQKLRVTHQPLPNETILAAIAGNIDCCVVFGNDSEKECLEVLENPAPPSPGGVSISSAPRLGNSIFDLTSPADQEAADGGDSSGSEYSQDTYQTSVFDGSSLPSSGSSAASAEPESSSSAVIRLQKIEEDCDGPSTYAPSKSSQGTVAEIAGSGLSGWKKWKSKGKYTRPSLSGHVHVSGSSVPRGATTETLPQRLGPERRMSEDEPNRRESTNTKKRERI